jgi:FdhD protein
LSTSYHYGRERITTLIADASLDSRTPHLAIEQAVPIEVNGERLATLMCTPRDLDVLALGHLFTRGMIASVDDVTSLRIDGEGVHVRVRRPPANPANPAARSLPRGEALPLTSIRGWVREMFARADIRRGTGGGMHSAGLADRGGLRWMYEDVGRHNAVDKVIGRGLVERVDFSRSCLISSGRIAVEIAAKVVAAGIPIVASRSIPTTATYEMAVERGLTMIGRIASDSPIVYTGGERLV